MKKILLGTTLILSTALCSSVLIPLQAHPIKPSSDSTIKEGPLATPENLEEFLNQKKDFGNLLSSFSGDIQSKNNRKLPYFEGGKPDRGTLYSVLKSAVEKNHDTLLVTKKDTEEFIPIMHGIDNIRKAYAIINDKYPNFSRLEKLDKDIDKLRKETTSSDPKLKSLKLEFLKLMIEEEMF